MDKLESRLLFIVVNILLITVIVYLGYYGELFSLRSIPFYIGMLILAICDIVIIQLLSNREECFVFIPLSDKELSEISINGDTTSLQSYVLNSGCKCKVLSKKDFSEFSKNNKGLYILMQDTSNIKALKKIYKDFRVSYLEIKNGNVSLIYSACKKVRNKKDLKALLLTPTFITNHCNLYSGLLSCMFTDLGDAELMCLKNGVNGNPMFHEEEYCWVNSLYGRVALFLLKMFDFKEMLNGRKLSYAEKDLSKKVECVLNYINRNNLARDQSDFYKMLRILSIFSYYLHGIVSFVYEFLDYKTPMSVNDFRLKEEICADLDIEVYRYILAIACYQGNEITDEEGGVERNCPVEANNQIKELLCAQHQDTVKAVHEILDACYNGRKIITEGSEEFQRLKILDILQCEEKEQIKKKEAYSVKELVNMARDILGYKYFTSILDSNFPHEYLTKQVEELGYYSFFEFTPEKIEHDRRKHIILVDRKTPDTIVDYSDITSSDVDSHITKACVNL